MTLPSRSVVLFDLDGTLIDSIDLILRSGRHAFEACGLDCPSDVDWLSGVGRPLPTMFRLFAPDESHVEPLIQAYRTFQVANHDALVSAYPGVPELLEGLAARGHRMAIVTSKTDALARRGLAHTGLERYFEAVVGMDSCQRHKPDPEPVWTALERVQGDARNAWFVGDSVHDMESGNAAGVATVGALWGPFSEEILRPSRPRYTAMRPADVLSLVEDR